MQRDDEHPHHDRDIRDPLSHPIAYAGDRQPPVSLRDAMARPPGSNSAQDRPRLA